MKFKLDKWQRDFNRSVWAGIAGGFFIICSQLFLEESIKINLIPDLLILKVSGTFILSLVFFSIMAFTFPAINLLKRRKKKMNLSLISSGVIGLIVAWATWESILPAAIFAGVAGLVSLIGGLISDN